MKRQVAIGVAVVVIGIVVVAIAMGVGRSKKVMLPGTKAPVKSAEVLKKQKLVTAAMAEAQRAYDSGNYQAAIDKTQAILKDVDGTSQEAKNLLQVAQLSQRGEMPGLNIPVAPAPAPAAVAETPVVNEEAAVPAQT